MELLTHGGEHHVIADGGWRMMTTTMNPPLRSPERTPSLPSRGRTGLGGNSVLWIAIILSPYFFGKIGFYSVGFRVCGATRWGQPTWVRQEGGTLVGCAHPGSPLRWILAPEILIY